MLLFDSHLDIAWNAIDWDRDLDLTVSNLREVEKGRLAKTEAGDTSDLPPIFRRTSAALPGMGRNTLTLPELREAGLAVCCATVLDRTAHPESPVGGSATHHLSYAKAMGQLAYYRLLESQNKMRMLPDAAALDAHWAAWQAEDADDLPLGYILSMEGADPIAWPEQAHACWDEGLRVVSLCHYGVSAYAYGTATEGGVTELGEALLGEMADCGMILDVSHLADEAFWQALKFWKGPLLASHNNCRSLVPGDRQFSDDQIRAIVERGGVIGVALDAWMLHPGWERGVTQPEVVGIEALARQIDHICVLAQGVEHVAIGSDLDGGYGTEQTPRDLDTYRDLHKVGDLLQERGYGDEGVAAVMHGNWMRFFREALP